MTSLHLYSASSAVQDKTALTRAQRHLAALGFEVSRDTDVLARNQRFAGEDETRLAALHRTAQLQPSIAMAARGGYGLTRLLDGIDWTLLGHSVERGTRWVGYSDVTALQLGLLCHGRFASWMGPMAVGDFGREPQAGGVDDVTSACFAEAMSGELEAVGFRTEEGFDGLEVKGTLWGGNLCVLTSMLGTRHWPRVKGGILVLEDVAEHPYRIERMLLQLHQAGVLDEQKAVLLGHFTQLPKSDQDRGYGLKSAIAALRARSRTPILTGLPIGHVPTIVTLPVGRKAQLVVDGRNALLGW